jgi:capsular polysaccharide transport system permease protein
LKKQIALSTDTTSSAVIDPGEEHQRKRFRRFLSLFFIAVVIPTIVSAFYYMFVASGFYVSEAKFTIYSNDSAAAGVIDSILPSTFGSHSARELYVIQEFVFSQNAMEKLDEDLDLLSYYQVDALDPLSRLSPDATMEEAFAYYEDLLEMTVDSQSGVATLILRAPQPEISHELAAALLRYSEKIVNDLTKRAQSDQIAFATSEVEKAEDLLLQKRVDVQGLQRRLDEFNPLESASGVSTIRMELESELVRARTALDSLRRLLQPDAYKLVTLRNRIASLEQQIANEKARLVDENDDSALNISAAEFEALAFEKEFAEERYTSALKFLEVSSLQALQQGKYLAVISPPTLPDQPAYPRKIFGVLTVFAISFCIFAVGGITLAVIREHTRV